MDEDGHEDETGLRARQKASGRDYARLPKRPSVSAGGEERDTPTPDRK